MLPLLRSLCSGVFLWSFMAGSLAIIGDCHGAGYCARPQPSPDPACVLLLCPRPIGSLSVPIAWIHASPQFLPREHVLNPSQPAELGPVFPPPRKWWWAKASELRGWPAEHSCCYHVCLIPSNCVRKLRGERANSLEEGPFSPMMHHGSHMGSIDMGVLLFAGTLAAVFVAHRCPPLPTSLLRWAALSLAQAQ